MKYKRLIIPLLALIISCKLENSPKVHVVTVKNFCDLTTVKGKPNFKDYFDIQIISYDDIMIYIVPSLTENIMMKRVKGNHFEPKSTTYVTAFRYHFVKKGMSYGFKYDSLNMVSGNKFRVDSLLDRLNIGKLYVEANGIADGKLVFSLNDKVTGKVLMEKFASNKKGEFDSTYRYYNYSMKDIPISIAPALDKKNATKTVKVVNIRNPKNTDSVKINREEISIEIVRSIYKDQKELSKWIEKFKREKKT